MFLRCFRESSRTGCRWASGCIFRRRPITGDEAVKTHIRYFEETQTDICKIMNECTYPCEHNIQAAADWKRVKVYDRGADFIQRQADVIRQVVDQVPDAATVATIHGVVASASHTLLGIPRYDSIGRFAQLYHLRTSPEEVWDAYKRSPTPYAPSRRSQ